MARINTNRKSGFILRSGVMRRESLWFSIAPVSNTLATGSAAVLAASLNAAALALRPFTVVRTRGVLYVRSDQAVATELYHAALGIAVVSDEAIAVGVSAVPTPDTERGSDLWFLYAETMGQIQIDTNVGFNDAGGSLVEFDSKAMRKVENGQDIAFVKETTAISTGAVVVDAGRMLVKLH